MNILSDQTVAIDEKVFLMKQDARFDVADDDQALLPDPSQICQEIRAGRSHPTVPKVFLSNDCAFNCSYCGCRSGNMCKRKYVNTPRELAELAVKQADSSGHGIFITSADSQNAGLHTGADCRDTADHQEGTGVQGVCPRQGHAGGWIRS